MFVMLSEDQRSAPGSPPGPAFDPVSSGPLPGAGQKVDDDAQAHPVTPQPEHLSGCTPEQSHRPSTEIVEAEQTCAPSSSAQPDHAELLRQPAEQQQAEQQQPADQRQLVPWHQQGFIPPQLMEDFQRYLQLQLEQASQQPRQVTGLPHQQTSSRPSANNLQSGTAATPQVQSGAGREADRERWAIEVGKDTQRLLDYVLNEPLILSGQVSLYLIYVMCDVPCAMGIAFRVSEMEARVADIHEKHLFRTVLNPLVNEIRKRRRRVRVQGHVEREDKVDTGLCEAAKRLKISRLVITSRRTSLRRKSNDAFMELSTGGLSELGCSVVVLQGKKRLAVVANASAPKQQPLNAGSTAAASQAGLARPTSSGSWRSLSFASPGPGGALSGKNKSPTSSPNNTAEAVLPAGVPLTQSSPQPVQQAQLQRQAQSTPQSTFHHFQQLLQMHQQQPRQPQLAEQAQQPSDPLQQPIPRNEPQANMGASMAPLQERQQLSRSDSFHSVVSSTGWASGSPPGLHRRTPRCCSDSRLLLGDSDVIARCSHAELGNTDPEGSVGASVRSGRSGRGSPEADLLLGLLAQDASQGSTMARGYLGQMPLASLVLELRRLQSRLDAAHQAEDLLKQTVEEAQDELKQANTQKAEESLRRVACEAELEIAKFQAQEASRTVAMLKTEVETAKKAAQEALALAEAAKKETRPLDFRTYTFQELSTATDGWSRQRLICDGESGIVYHGLLDGHMNVAIRVLKDPMAPGALEEFQKEVRLGGELRHPNLVLLMGCCMEPPCLVYEYMPQGSLLERLVCFNGSPPLHWTKRFDVFCDICSALVHLHCRDNPIVHFDLKPSNVLLDRNFVAKLGDVGLARIMRSLSDNTVSVPLGTLGYACPELLRSNLFCSRTDVYSLGMVLYDLLGGTRSSGRTKGLVQAMEEAVAEEDIKRMSQLTDPSARWPPELAMDLARLARECTATRRRDRPEVAKGVMPWIERLRPMVERLAIQEAEAERRRARRLTALASAAAYGSMGDLEEAAAEVAAPNSLICPINLEVMEKPVIAADGHTYEEAAIRKWIAEHDTSPVTNAPLEHKHLIPNHNLRSLILDWRENRLVHRPQRRISNGSFPRSNSSSSIGSIASHYCGPSPCASPLVTFRGTACVPSVAAATGAATLPHAAAPVAAAAVPHAAEASVSDANHVDAWRSGRGSQIIGNLPVFSPI